MKKQMAIGLSMILIGLIIAVIGLLFPRVPPSTPFPCGSNPCTGTVYEPGFFLFVSGIVVIALGLGISVLTTLVPRFARANKAEANPTI